MPIFGMARARHLGQSLQQRLGLAHDQLGDDLVVKPPEQIAIAGEVAAVEERNGELSIVGDRNGRTQPACATPDSVSSAGPTIPARSLRTGSLKACSALRSAKEKKQIDIGIREQPAAAESSGGQQGKAGKGLASSGENDIAP
jgi:hypothetical protein